MGLVLVICVFLLCAENIAILTALSRESVSVPIAPDLGLVFSLNFTVSLPNVDVSLQYQLVLSQ